MDGNTADVNNGTASVTRGQQWNCMGQERSTMELHGSREVNNGTAWVRRGQQWNCKGHERSTMELHGSGGEVNNGTAWVARGQQWNFLDEPMRPIKALS